MNIIHNAARTKSNLLQKRIFYVNFNSLLLKTRTSSSMSAASKRRRNLKKKGKQIQLKNTIAAKKELGISKEGSQSSIPSSTASTTTFTNTTATSTPLKGIGNTFFLLVIFPILMTGALIIVNEDIRNDFMKTFGLESNDGTKILEEETKRKGNERI